MDPNISQYLHYFPSQSNGHFRSEQILLLSNLKFKVPVGHVPIGKWPPRQHPDPPLNQLKFITELSLQLTVIRDTFKGGQTPSMQHQSWSRNCLKQRRRLFGYNLITQRSIARKRFENGEKLVSILVISLCTPRSSSPKTQADFLGSILIISAGGRSLQNRDVTGKTIPQQQWCSGFTGTCFAINVPNSSVMDYYISITAPADIG
jgi:hypothetical protein